MVSALKKKKKPSNGQGVSVHDVHLTEKRMRTLYVWHEEKEISV